MSSRAARHRCGVAVAAVVLGDLRQLVGGQREQAGDEHRLGDAARPVLGGLERLARGRREAVEVEAVVPVGPTDQRQPVRTEPVERVAHRALQVLVQRRLRARLVVEGHLLVEDPAVARLLHVGGDGEDQPQRVVVEAGSDGVVAALRQRLVLVVGAAGRELGRGDVEDALRARSGTMCTNPSRSWFESRKPMPRPMPGLEQRGRARQVERDHALVRVPDVDHPVGVLVRRG